MRRPHDPIQMLSVWAGVLAAFLVVVGAWWWASKPGYLHVFSTPLTSGFEPVVQDAKDFGKKVSDLSADRAASLRTELEKTASRLDALQQQAEKNQTSLDRMAAFVETATTTGTGAAVRTTGASVFQPPTPTSTQTQTF